LPGLPDVAPVLDMPARKGISWKALVGVLLGALVFLGGGVALVIFCFSLGKPAHHRKQQTDNDTASVNRDETGKDRGAKPTNPKPLARLSHGQQVEVDKAVERAVAYLKSIQNPNDGTWTANTLTLPNNPAGITALAGLTLLECGVKKDDPAIQKVAAYLRQREKSDNNKIVNTYEVSLAILFFDRLDLAQDRGLIQKLALRLVAGQTPGGGWSYGTRLLSDNDSQLLASLLEKSKGGVSADPLTSKLQVKAVDPSKLRPAGSAALPGPVANLPVWRAGVTLGGQPLADNSNTQFAILGLWAAKARGAPVERALALVVQRFHNLQNADGSWGYYETGPRKAPTTMAGHPASMTCPGLLGLAVGQGLVNEARTRNSPARKQAYEQDPAIQRGLDYLARQLGDPHKPWENASGAPPIDLYFLWSVERVGVIFNLPKIGGKDWYGWGAEKLIANQKIVGDNGYWENGRYYAQHPTVNTCFALLFLKQANLAKDLTAKLVPAN
jgi:hypothetical protein